MHIMKRITQEDLAAFARAEAEILSLPSTERSESFEPLVETPEYREHLDDHEDAEPVVIVANCLGIGVLCEHHAPEILAALFRDRALRLNGADEDELEECPVGCGRKAVDCWRIVDISVSFLRGEGR
jgi:hypothetical protein